MRTTNDYSIVIEGNLPFIENWLTTQSSIEILGNDLFNQELQGIIQSKIITGEGVQRALDSEVVIKDLIKQLRETLDLMHSIKMKN
ncbi:hypothetical protein CV093_12390 [Oceanobacillus sp. 143]|nr:hypothetical protein CV093_12390 [Oceanobacillus sp. 143]